ncbi:hypothetical protein VZT92_014677 [Zoarces viviparus]|uniref:Uncharacterized protein n=1 Tax=Zoarces viviparus TaxID=48416 RepID=A0AAW1F3G2_ZOAVI
MFGIKGCGSVGATLPLLYGERCGGWAALLPASPLLKMQPLPGLRQTPTGSVPLAEARHIPKHAPPILCFRGFTELSPAASVSKQHPVTHTKKSLSINLHANKEDDEQAALYKDQRTALSQFDRSAIREPQERCWLLTGGTCGT